jgi:hypothetical protein
MFEAANDGEMHPMQIRRKFVGSIAALYFILLIVISYNYFDR